MDTHIPSQLLPILSELPPIDHYGFPKLLTPKETSLYLKMPLPTVYYLIKQKRLPAYQIGGRLRVKRDLLDQRISKSGEHDAPSAMVLADEPDTQNFYRKHLKATGYSRVFVGTGEEAICCARRQNFEILFVDLAQWDMPLSEIISEVVKYQPNILPFVVQRNDQAAELLKAMAISPIVASSHPMQSEAMVRVLRQLK